MNKNFIFQNARQAVSSLASYTKYDELGRTIEAGELEIPSGTGMTDLDYLNTKTEDNNFPGILLRGDYTITHYEESYPDDNGDIAARFTGGQQNLRNAIGAVEHYQSEVFGIPAVGQGFKTVVSYSYDAHKNVNEVVTSNYDLRQIDQEHKKTDYEYDLVSGNVNEVIYQEGFEDEYHHLYHYDANNRLVRVFTSDDHGITYEKDAKYFYYLHGTLARVELGEDEVQGMDYAYNLNGWLKGVNASTLVAKRDLGNDAADGINKHFGRDAFGFALGYYANDYTPIENITPFANTAQVQALNLNDEPTAQNGNNHGSLYNGNISHMVVAMSDANEAPMDVLANNYRYDQLQRIKAQDVYYDANVMLSNDFSTAGLYRTAGGEGAYQTRYSFDKNGNLASLKRNGSGKDQNGNTIALSMDEFTYNYYETSSNTASTTTTPQESNRLSHVADAIAASNYDTDIDPGQITANYKYDASGQLIQDLDEEIEQIKWTVTGKVKEIRFTSGSSKNDLKFVYGPMDMRVMKIEYTNENSKNSIRTYYSYDAQGNVMATYKRTILANFAGSGANSDYTDEFVLNEQMVYGSSRIGMEQKNRVITTAEVNETTGTINFELGEGVSWDVVTQESYDLTFRKLEDKNYELTEHRGNVVEVITDRKLPVDDGVFDSNGNLTSTTPDGIVDYYAVNVVTYTDYAPYGAILDGRHGGEAYRYSFQNQESDPEIKGEGNSINYKYRMHDPRIGRFFAVDPLAPKYSHYTPYQFSGNKVIAWKELEGLEETGGDQGSTQDQIKANEARIKELQELSAATQQKIDANLAEINRIVEDYDVQVSKFLKMRNQYLDNVFSLQETKFRIRQLRLEIPLVATFLSSNNFFSAMSLERSGFLNDEANSIREAPETYNFTGGEVTIWNYETARAPYFRYNNGWVGFSEILTLPTQGLLSEGFQGVGLNQSEANIFSSVLVDGGSLFLGSKLPGLTRAKVPSQYGSLKFQKINSGFILRNTKSNTNLLRIQYGNEWMAPLKGHTGLGSQQIKHFNVHVGNTNIHILTQPSKYGIWTNARYNPFRISITK